MPVPNPFEITLSGLSLNILARMTGPHHQFRTGKRGYYFIDQFDWNGKQWRLRFQAFVKHSLVINGMTGLPEERPVSGTTHGMLEDIREGTLRVPSGFVLNTKSVGSSGANLRKWESDRLTEDQLREAGWKLRKLPDGIQAVFDLSLLHRKPSGKLFSFASCNIKIDGVLYLCQFHIREHPDPLPKPTEWDWSRGARAGLPTLGKRR